jgi:hypothetical protein
MKKKWHWPSAIIGAAAAVVIVGGAWTVSTVVQANAQQQAEQDALCELFTPGSADYFMCMDR